MRTIFLVAQAFGLAAALPSNIASRSAQSTASSATSRVSPASSVTKIASSGFSTVSLGALSSRASSISPSPSGDAGNVTNHHNGVAASSNWWFPAINSRTSSSTTDKVPGLNGYQVYFSVNSGDSQGFIDAIQNHGPNGGQRDNGYLAMEPRVVYLPPGTYTLQKTLYIWTDTVIIGDAVNPPVIQPSSNFQADSNFMIVGGQGEDNASRGGELHFSVMFKNVIFDTTPQKSNSDFTALSWRVAQNSALVNVQVRMPQGVHTGVWVGQGSPISVSDTSFSYGNIGLHYAGAQQAQLKNLQFVDCTNGIYIDNGFTISIIAPKFNTVGNSIVYNSGSPSVSVVDAVSVNSGNFFTSNQKYPNFILDNISKDTTNSAMVIVGGKTIFGGIKSLSTYVYGNTRGANPIYQTGSNTQNVPRPSALTTGNGAFPVLTAPQYNSKTVNDVINLKDPSQNGGVTLHGDGSSDDTSALQTALNTAASAGKIAYLPFGVYLVSNTITIPLGTNLVGNGWSTISGYGKVFQTESSPVPVVQVGKPNDKGTIQIQDIRFTVKQQSPGAIILQVNAAGTSPGSVAIFNSLITLGGTPDSDINCSQSAQSRCAGAYLGLLMAAGSSAYVDNFWAWVADHPSDGSSNGIYIAGKGGVQVDSKAATWFGGLGSEHWWLFNYNHNNAENVLTSFYQSETNYYQGSSGVPPAPFHPTSSDPTFSWCGGSSGTCSRTIAQYFNGGKNHFQYGAGSWTFDDGPQDNLNVINQYPSPMYLFGTCGLAGGNGNGASNAFRLPDGSTFGQGSIDGYGGSWGILVAEFTH